MKFTHFGKLEKSFEGLMAGNGSIGALIYGDKKLLISLDLINLWDNRLPLEFKDPNFNYPYMVNCIKNDYKELYRLFDNCYNHPYPTKINAGLLEIDTFIDDKTLFEINYLNGIFNFDNQELKIKGYIDAKKDVLILKSNKKLSYKVLMSEYFKKDFDNGGLNYPPYKENKIGSFYQIKQPMYANKHYSIFIYEANNGLEYSYYLTISKYKTFKMTKEFLLDYVKKEQTYFASTLAYWNSYYSKSFIRTPDEDLNSLYIKGLYYFSCNSRKKYPMTLQGVWTQNNNYLPPWKSDLHNDINVEMTYDSYFKTGNFKEGKIIVNYLKKHQKEFSDFASSFMKSSGLLIPGVMTQNGLPLGGWPQYALSPAVSIWILKVLDDYYCYTNDKNVLKDVCYPFFKGTEQCLNKYLRLNKDDNYELDFHSSPEFYENDRKSIFAKQTNFELTMYKFLYSCLVKYCKELEIDYSKYEKIKNKLAPFYRDGNKLLLISKDEPFSSSHRHFSHMLMYKNFKMVSPFSSSQLIENDINHLVSFSTSEWVGFSFVEASGLYSYIMDGENAYKYLKIFSNAFVHPNGFHMNSDYKHLGYSTLNCYVLTLEANMGFVSSLCDMMTSFIDDVLTIFPAIPQFFKEKWTSFKDLRIPNKGKVSASYANGKLSFEVIYPKAMPVKLYNNIGNNPSLMIDGQYVSFHSNIGEIIEIEKARVIKYETH